MAVGVAVMPMLQLELPDSDVPQASLAMAKSPEFAPPKVATHPVADSCPEFVTVKVLADEVTVTAILPKLLVAVRLRDAGVAPVTVIPFAVDTAETEFAQATESEVVFEPVVVGFAVTLNEQFPPAATLEQEDVLAKLKLVVSPIDTVQPVASTAPELERVTVVAEVEVLTATVPNGIVSGEKARDAGAGVGVGVLVSKVTELASTRVLTFPCTSSIQTESTFALFVEVTA